MDGMKHLRYYQKEIIKELFLKLKTVKRCLVVAPTGSGKTVICGAIVEAALSKSRKCWFVVHREELVEQTVKTFGFPCGIVKAGHKPSDNVIQIGSVQTMGSRGTLIGPDDVVIIDEAHTVCFFGWAKRLFETHGGFIIGVTATPWRAKKTEGLMQFFEDYVATVSPSMLIEQGFLCPAKYYSFKTFDTKKLRVFAGDYAQNDLEQACNTEQACEVIHRETMKIGGRGIIFAVSVDHAFALAAKFGCPVVHGETPNEERRKIYDDLRSGKISWVSSVGVLTEGFDVKEINCVVLARPTKSKALNAQMVGRALRICEGKTIANILDFAQNWHRFGLATDMDLKQMAPDYPGEAGQGVMELKECPKCGHVCIQVAKECPSCHHEFGSKEKSSIVGNLVEIKSKLCDKKYKSSFGEFMKTAVEKRYNPIWAKMQVFKTLGRYPTKLEMNKATFLGDESKKREFWDYLMSHGNGRDWALKFYEVEFGNIKK